MSTSLKGLHILVIEDDFYLAEDMRQALQDAGATVLGPCRDATEAFQALERDHADCAVVDINLGQGPCFEPARRLIARALPIILVTGYDAEVLPADLANVPCLQKPTEATKIATAVKNVCAAASGRSRVSVHSS